MVASQKASKDTHKGSCTMFAMFVGWMDGCCFSGKNQLLDEQIKS